MKKALKRLIAKPTGDLTGVTGDLSGVTGDLTGVRGDLTGVRGYLTGVRGDLTGVRGYNIPLSISEGQAGAPKVAVGENKVLTPSEIIAKRQRGEYAS